MTTTDGKYDVDDVRDALRGVVSRQPDKRSRFCYRNQDGTPECVIAHLLVEFGLDDVLDRVDNHSPVNLLSRRDKATYDPGFASLFADGALDLMMQVQSEQDDGLTWGKALVLHDPDFDLDAVS